MDKSAASNRGILPVRRLGCVIGIDIGLKGAVAVFDPVRDQLVTVWDMPTTNIIKDRKNHWNLDDEKLDSQLADACKEYDVQLICIEAVTASMQMGVSSAFKFGETYGMTKRAARNNCLHVELVSPVRWKPRMMVTADKKTSLTLARKIWGAQPWFPLEKHDGRAEAALLAKYAANEYITVYRGEEDDEEVDPLS